MNYNWIGNLESNLQNIYNHIALGFTYPQNISLLLKYIQ